MKFERVMEEFGLLMQAVVSCPRDSPQAADLTRTWSVWCDALRRCSSEFDADSHEALFNLLLRGFPMAEAPAEFFESYRLVILSGCQAQWLQRLTLQTLISTYFIAVPADSAAGQRVHSLLHSLLHESLDLTPQVSNLIRQAYPWRSRPFEEHQFFLHNVLWTLGYVPTLYDRVFETLVSKLLEVDVEINFENMAQDDAQAEEDGGMFVMDNGGPTNGTANVQLEFVAKLDMMMDMVFCFLRDIPANTISDVFSTLMRLFENKIARTHQSKHPQFLVFFLCGRAAQLSDLPDAAQPLTVTFINSLLRTLLEDPTADNLAKSTAANYLGSFLARFSSIALEHVHEVLARLIDFAVNYVERHQAEHQALAYVPDVPSRHSVFYNVFQAIIYVLCFHFTGLSASAAEPCTPGQYFRHLGLRALASCRLNPMFFCLPVVCREFALLSTAVGGESFDDILQRNSTLLDAGHAEHYQSTAAAEQLFKPSFAFDPYLLHDSAQHIQPMYRDWGSGGEEDDVDSVAPNGDQMPSRTHSIGSYREPNGQTFSGSFNDSFCSSIGTPEDLQCQYPGGFD